MPVTLILALGAGTLSAVAVYAILVGSLLALPLFYFASLPLYLAGLGLGSKGVLLAVLAALVTVGVIGSVQTALPYALAYAVPALIVCQRALRVQPMADGTARYTSGGEIIAGLTAGGAALLTAVAAMTLMDGGSEPLADMVANFLRAAFEAMSGDIDPQAREHVVQSLAPLFPGMAVASWVFMHVINAATGQSLLQRSGRNLRPAMSYLDITLPDWCSWLLVISGAAALLLPGDLSYVGRNLVIVALVPFFVLGLAVVHGFARRSGRGTTLLVAFYILLVVFGPTAFLVAGAGVLEQWIGLRKRLPSDNDQENV